MPKETLYERLGLPRDASIGEIRKAYQEIARSLHPDLHTKPGVTDRFASVQEAFEILTDPDRKTEYDSQLPSLEAQPFPVTISTSYSRRILTHSFEPQLIYAQVDLSLSEQARSEKRPQLNLCLVIDCSTSMQGVRLDTAKETAIELVRQLQPTDILSIVRFSDRAEVLLPANLLVNQRNLEFQIQMLSASGGTEIYQGLNLGMRETRRFRHANRINHIILITDGRTYGDEEHCLQLADQATSLQVGLSAFGIGGSWNDTFLDTLTAKTGGSSMFISNAQDIRHFLLEKANSLGDIYANNVTYNFDTPDDVELSFAFRIFPEAAPLNTASPVILGAVPRKKKLAFLFEFRVNRIHQDATQVQLAEGRLSYQTPGELDSSTFIQRLDFERSIGPLADTSPPPMAIVHAMSHLTLYRMQEKAREDMARGDIQAASRRLQNLATHLLAQGQRDLARQVFNEINHIQQYHSFSTDGEKQIKYGTRSLIPPLDKEENEHD